MKTIDTLIKKLEEVKEELSKNVNMSYAQKPNVATGSMSGALERSESPEQVDHEMRETAEKSEYLELFKNGQWQLRKDSVNPALAPKQRKIKELQTKIDAGTYKPNASAIAGKMIASGAIKKDEHDC